MAFPFTDIEEDPFDPYAEEIDQPPYVPDWIEQGSAPRPSDEAMARGGITDDLEVWNNPRMLGTGVGRPQMNDPAATIAPTRPQDVGLTPPYGTRREPSVNPVAQDPRDINQFIRESLRQGEYRDMPEEARDVHEQIDMIRGAAPRMPPQDIQRFLEEQMRGQGYMLPPRPEDAIPPEYEEEVFRGRRFG